MNKPTPSPDHLTGAELQTLREALHLSRDDLADLAGVQARTVKHWENGRSGVPGDVAALLQALDAQVTQAAREALALLASAARLPGELVLTRYRTTADLQRYRPDLRPMPAGAQAAIVARVRLGLQLAAPAGEALPRVRVVWFDPAHFEAWRTLNQQPNSEASRADWAALALAEQAIPHRADQPPA